MLRGLFYLRHGAVHGLISTYNYLISSCAYPGWELEFLIWIPLPLGNQGSLVSLGNLMRLVVFLHEGGKSIPAECN